MKNFQPIYLLYITIFLISISNALKCPVRQTPLNLTGGTGQNWFMWTTDPSDSQSIGWRISFGTDLLGTNELNSVDVGQRFAYPIPESLPYNNSIGYWSVNPPGWSNCTVWPFVTSLSAPTQNLPYVVDFDEGVPNKWTRNSGYTFLNVFSTVSSTSNIASDHTGGGSFLTMSQSTVGANTIYSPLISFGSAGADAQLTFWLYNSDTSASTPSTLQIYARNGLQTIPATGTATFTLLSTISSIYSKWTLISIPVGQYATQSFVRFAFTVTLASLSAPRIGIDDVRIGSGLGTPVCSSVIRIAPDAQSLSGTTSVLQWSYTQTNAIRPLGFWIYTDTNISRITPDGSLQVQTVPTLVQGANVLAHPFPPTVFDNTTLYWMVVPQAYNQTTPTLDASCAPYAYTYRSVIVRSPYEVDFVGAIDGLPDNWRIYNSVPTPSTVPKWAITDTASNGAQTGFNDDFFLSIKGATGGNTQSIWTPVFEAPGGVVYLTFRIQNAFVTGGAANTLTIEYVNETARILNPSIVWNSIYTSNSARFTSWSFQRVLLSGLSAGGTYRFRLTATLSILASDISIDTFRLGPALPLPKCPVNRVPSLFMSSPFSWQADPTDTATITGWQFSFGSNSSTFDVISNVPVSSTTYPMILPARRSLPSLFYWTVYPVGLYGVNTSCVSQSIYWQSESYKITLTAASVNNLPYLEHFTSGAASLSFPTGYVDDPMNSFRFRLSNAASDFPTQTGYYVSVSATSASVNRFYSPVFAGLAQQYTVNFWYQTTQGVNTFQFYWRQSASGCTADEVEVPPYTTACWNLISAGPTSAPPQLGWTQFTATITLNSATNFRFMWAVSSNTVPATFNLDAFYIIIPGFNDGLDITNMCPNVTGPSRNQENSWGTALTWTRDPTFTFGSGWPFYWKIIFQNTLAGLTPTVPLQTSIFSTGVETGYLPLNSPAIPPSYRNDPWQAPVYKGSQFYWAAIPIDFPSTTTPVPSTTLCSISSFKTAEAPMFVITATTPFFWDFESATTPSPLPPRWFREAASSPANPISTPQIVTSSNSAPRDHTTGSGKFIIWSTASFSSSDSYYFVTPPLNLTQTRNPVLTFFVWNSNTPGLIASTITVSYWNTNYYPTAGLANWATMASFVGKEYMGGWKEIRVPLSTLITSLYTRIRIGISGTSASGTVLAMDDIRIAEVPPIPQCPVVISPGNGAQAFLGPLTWTLNNTQRNTFGFYLDVGTDNPPSNALLNHWIPAVQGNVQNYSHPLPNPPIGPVGTRYYWSLSVLGFNDTLIPCFTRYYWNAFPVPLLTDTVSFAAGIEASGYVTDPQTEGGDNWFDDPNSGAIYADTDLFPARLLSPLYGVNPDGQILQFRMRHDVPEGQPEMKLLIEFLPRGWYTPPQVWLPVFESGATIGGWNRFTVDLTPFFTSNQMGAGDTFRLRFTSIPTLGVSNFLYLNNINLFAKSNTSLPQCPTLIAPFQTQAAYHQPLQWLVSALDSVSYGSIPLSGFELFLGTDILATNLYYGLALANDLNYFPVPEFEYPPQVPIGTTIYWSIRPSSSYGVTCPVQQFVLGGYPSVVGDFPYRMEFDTPSPTDWHNDHSFDAGSQFLIQSTIADHTSGTGSYLVTDSAVLNGFPSTSNISFVSPVFYLQSVLQNPILTFWLLNQRFQTSGVSTLFVEFTNSTFVNSNTTFTTLLQVTQLCSSWTQFSISLSNLQLPSVRFRFRATNLNPINMIAIDDFAILEAPVGVPACLPDPGPGVDAITWKPQYSAASYRVEIGTTAGASDLLNINTTQSFANVWPDEYFIRISPQNVFGIAPGCSIYIVNQSFVQAAQTPATIYYENFDTLSIWRASMFNVGSQWSLANNNSAPTNGASYSYEGISFAYVSGAPTANVTGLIQPALISPKLINLASYTRPTLSLWVWNRRTFDPLRAPSILHFDMNGATFGTWDSDFVSPITSQLNGWTQINIDLTPKKLTLKSIRLRAELRYLSDLSIDRLSIYDLANQNTASVPVNCVNVSLFDGQASQTTPFIQMSWQQELVALQNPFFYLVRAGTTDGGNEIYDNLPLAYMLQADPAQFTQSIVYAQVPMTAFNSSTIVYLSILPSLNGVTATSCPVLQINTSAVINYPKIYSFDSDSSGFQNSIWTQQVRWRRVPSTPYGAPFGRTGRSNFFALPSNSSNLLYAPRLISPRFVTPQATVGGQPGYLVIQFWLQNLPAGSTTTSPSVLHVDALLNGGSTRVADVITPISRPLTDWSFVSGSFPQFTNTDVTFVFRVEPIVLQSDISIDDVYVSQFTPISQTTGALPTPPPTPATHTDTNVVTDTSTDTNNQNESGVGKLSISLMMTIGFLIMLLL